jgi:mannose-1-phosphate guanylyltransferase/phosphomannomutase
MLSGPDRRLRSDGFEVSPGVWVAEGAEVDPEAAASRARSTSATTPRSRPGRAARVHRARQQRVVKEGAFLHRAVVHDQRLRRPVHQPAGLRHRQEHRPDGRGPGSRRARSSGTSASSRPRRTSPTGVKVYPFKTIEAGAVVNTSVIWESAGSAPCSARAGSPACQRGDHARARVRLASAYATTLKKGAVVTTRATCRGPPARSSARSRRAQRQRDRRGGPGGAAAAGGQVRDRPQRGRRRHRAADHPRRPAVVDIIFLDERGAELSAGGGPRSWSGCSPAGVPAAFPARSPS